MRLVEKKKCWKSLFESDDVTPSGGGILALKILLHGTCKDICPTFTARLSVLLGAKDNRLRAVDLVDTVYDCIKAF